MVLDRFYPEIGGAEKQALLLSKFLINNNVSVMVVTARSKYLSKYEIFEKIKIFRVSVFGWLFFRQVWLMVTVALKIYNLRNNFDLIHIHGAKHSAFAACLIGYFINKPTLYKVTKIGDRFDLKMLDAWYAGIVK